MCEKFILCFKSVRFCCTKVPNCCKIIELCSHLDYDHFKRQWFHRESNRKKKKIKVKSSHIEIQMVDTDVSDHCKKDALTGFLGLMLQAVLAGLAFTCLIGTIIVFFSFLSIQTSFLLSIYNKNMWTNQVQQQKHETQFIIISCICA